MTNLDRFYQHLSLTNTNRSKAQDLIFGTIYHHGPITRPQLALLLKNQVGHTTVYRTIHRFMEIDVVKEISAGLFQITDRFQLHHHYFRCRICGNRRTFNNRAIEAAISRMSKQDLKIEEHHLELVGVCSSCTRLPDVSVRRPIGDNLRRPPGL